MAECVFPDEGVTLVPTLEEYIIQEGYVDGTCFPNTFFVNILCCAQHYIADMEDWMEGHTNGEPVGTKAFGGLKGMWVTGWTGKQASGDMNFRRYAIRYAGPSGDPWEFNSFVV